MPLRSHRAPATFGAIKKPAWLLPGFIRERTITMITASPNTGKTMLGMRMAMSVVSSLPFFGVSSARRVPVLYCAWDAPDWDYAGIYHKLVRGIPSSHRPRPRKRHLSPYDDLVLLWERAPIDTFKAEDFIRCVRSCFKCEEEPGGYDPGLIIFDTFAESHSSGDENNNMEMRKVMQAFKGLSHTLGIPTVVLHHPPHTPPGQPIRARGATIVEGSADTQLTLTAAAKDPAALTLAWRKIRGENRPSKVHYRMETGTNEKGEFIILEEGLSPNEEKSARLERLIELLKSPRRSVTLCSTLEISRPTLSRYLKELGAVKRKGRWYYKSKT